MDFRSCFDPRHRDEIIRENALIHQELQVRFGENVKKKAYVDYVNRYSGVKKIVSGWKEEKGKMGQIPICNNFSLFLCARGEYEFSKFSVFEQALLFASNNKVLLGPFRSRWRNCCTTKICWAGCRRSSRRAARDCTTSNTTPCSRRNSSDTGSCSRSTT